MDVESVRSVSKGSRVLITLVLGMAASSVNAASIISTSTTKGSIDILSTAPTDVTEEQLTGDSAANIDVLRIFKEQSNLTLSQNVLVDIDTSKLAAYPTTFTGGGSVPPASVSGTLSTGTSIDSFFFHLDEPTNELGRVEGSVTFDADILAVITNSDTLVNTHAVFGSLGTTYPSVAGNHGTLEDTDDYITFTGPRTLNFQVSQLAAMDQFRVITAVPVPAALWLFGSGLLGLIGIFRRKVVVR